MKSLTTVDKANGKILELEVPVSIPDRVVTEQEAIEALRRQGEVLVPDQYLRDLETIGIHARKVALKMQRGKAMVNQTNLEALIRQLVTVLLKAKMQSGDTHVDAQGVVFIDPADMAKLYHEAGFLASKLTESQRLMIELEGVLRPTGAVQEPEQENSSFPVGGQVKAGATQVIAGVAHFHGTEKPKESS